MGWEAEEELTPDGKIKLVWVDEPEPAMPSEEKKSMGAARRRINAAEIRPPENGALLAEAIRNIPMPDRLRKLPVSDNGFPIPAFVAWLDIEGKRYLPEGTRGAIRDFRVIDPSYITRCFNFGRCWICGEELGRFRVFALGPMCCVSRTTMEPPSHRDCVEYAARACPFMVRPRMVRNHKGLPGNVRQPGIGIARNPGAYALWETSSYSRFAAPGGLLCKVGDADRVDWWAEGRMATRAEVVTSIDSGMPILMNLALKDGPGAVYELKQRRLAIERCLPKA